MAGGEHHGRHFGALGGEARVVAGEEGRVGEVGLERGHVHLHGHGAAGGRLCVAAARRWIE